MRPVLWSLVALTTFLFGLMPSAAQAANELALSWDGDTWSGQLSEPLFDPAAVWVPGDVGTASFHVRNQATSGAMLTIGVITQDDDGLLRQEDIRLSARVGAGDWVDLKDTTRNFRLDESALPQGESRTVEVRALFDPASRNRSQRKQLELTFRVTLSDAQASPEDSTGPGNPDDQASTPPGGSADPDDESHGTLPNAGAPAVGWFIVAAGVAIGAGLTLLKRRKRKVPEHGRTH